jgi:hypothetical protein
MLQHLDYDYCLIPPGASGDAIRLLKLHGSLNWGKVRNTDEIVAYPMEKLLQAVQLIQLIQFRSSLPQ